MYELANCRDILYYHLRATRRHNISRVNYICDDGPSIPVLKHFVSNSQIIGSIFVLVALKILCKCRRKNFLDNDEIQRSMNGNSL